MDNETPKNLLNNYILRENNKFDNLNKIKEKEDGYTFLMNTLNLCKDISNENVFYIIIENINTYIDKLKKEKKFYDFIFSYNGVIEEYYSLNEEYIIFTKIIENLNSLDIIELFITFNFNKKLFDILLFSYNELHLIEIKKIYYILFELIYVLIENLTYYMEENTFSGELIDKMFLSNDLKYINKKQINNIYTYINEKSCDYMNMIFSLLEFFLDLIDKIYDYILNSNIDCNNYINDLIIIKKDIYEKIDNNPNERHHLDLCRKELNSAKINDILINNIYFKKRENTHYDDIIENYTSIEKKDNENKSTDKEKKLLDCTFICNYEDNVVLIKNNSNDNNGDVEERKKKSSFAFEIKLININLNLLKIIICTLFKAKKVTHYMNEKISKRFFYVFNEMINDIIRSLYKKKHVLFLDYFFSDILKNVSLLVFYYNENIEDAPKQTMLFYKSLNKVIDQVSIYLHNRKIFYELNYDKKITKNFFNIRKFLYNFDKTYYILFYLFYTIIEKTNRLNNEIFLFFCSEIISKIENDEEKKVNIGDLEEKEEIIKLKLEKLYLNKKFLISYRNEKKEKSINRIITIFIFLEKKIKKYFCFFKYIFSFIWNKFKKRKKKKKKNILSDFDLIRKKIKYVLLDIFIKFTDALVIYKYCFNENSDVNVRVSFFDEFHLYMKSVQQIIFTTFTFAPDDIIEKIDKYSKNKSKLVKYNIDQNEFVEFNKKLYYFYELNNIENNNLRNKEKNTINISDNFINRKKNISEEGEYEYNIYKGDNVSYHENDNTNTNKENICKLYSSIEQIMKYDFQNCKKMENPNNFIEFDMIGLNVLSVIFMNIMKEIINNKYKFAYFKKSIIHIELVKKLLYVLINNNNNNITDNINDFKEKKIFANKEKKDLDNYFFFPYEFLSSIIISQLKCFVNNNLNNYKIFIIFLEFLFYISSSINPFFFYISKKLWEFLGYFINKNNDTESLSALLHILFYLISDKEKNNVLKSNEIIFHKKKKTNSKQYFLFLFLKNQIVLNRNGKNYLFFFHIFLKNINSEELISTVMKSFFYKYHINLQYSLNILLKYLNAYEQKVEKREKEDNEKKEFNNEKNEKKTINENIEINNIEYKNSHNVNVSLSKNVFQKNMENDEVIDENRIISIFIYFDIIKILPKRFLHFINDINLMKEFQNFFYFLIYLYDEFKLLEKRNEKYIHTKIFNKIKIMNEQYYYNCAKIYFPMITSSLISHFVFSLLNENSFLSNFRIIKFYENFFSNKNLYTLCNNYIYIKILNESFIILLYLKKNEKYLNDFEMANDKKNEIKESEKGDSENLLEFENSMSNIKAYTTNNNKIDGNLNIFSCLFKVYIIFVEEYSYFFFSSMMVLIKNDIILNEYDFINFYKNVHDNLKNKEKYSPSFKYLMLSILEYFFNKKNTILDNESTESTTVDKKENIKLLHDRKNFLNIFFQNCSSSQLLSNFYLKNELSKFLQKNLKNISSENDVENLSDLLLVNLHIWTNI
ncbi:conserved Plasmodium protein, unknown function [Plasmodium gallinaceum]|uniref:Uncharacterized protein n=1 Tax=Plasmodium gallinaceum TaxID=5849 RepID=A0A1J1GWW6_PLAGA|nr:conserved Plasmodium protein, unknown function [Plasmodium gallinaceum]CRG96751.1 conserved Plasmodium protein, unknown function [Plasmodium gallinaceum]